MKRKLGGLVMAMALAVFGTAVLVAYVQSAHNKVSAAEQSVPVVVSAKPIGKGAPATQDMVKTVDMPARLKVDGVVANLDALKGLVARSDVQVGQQLTMSMFQPATDAAKTDAPPGKELVTVSLDPDSALGGRIKVGDSVAVVATVKVPVSDTRDIPATRMLMRKVMVTAVQGDVQDRTAVTDASGTTAAAKSETKKATAEPTSRTFLVTLAVPPDVSEKVIYAAEEGKLYLTLEPPDATDVVPPPVAGATELS